MVLGEVFNSPATIFVYAMILIVCVGQLAVLLKLRADMRRDIKEMRVELSRMIDEIHNDVRSMRAHIAGVYGRGAERPGDEDPVH